MKIPAITLLGLTVLFALGGVKVASDSGGFFTWVGALLPAGALLYMAVRVWRDKPDTPKREGAERLVLDGDKTETPDQTH